METESSKLKNESEIAGKKRRGTGLSTVDRWQQAEQHWEYTKFPP